MADLPIFDTSDGTTPVPQSASAGGDSFKNDEQVYLEATGPSSEFKIIVHNGRQCEFGDHPDYEAVSPAGETYIRTSRFDSYRFNDRSGRVRVTYEPSAVGIQITALRHHAYLKDVEVSS